MWFMFCLKCQWHLLQNYHIYLILCLSALMDSTMDSINSCYVWQWPFSFFFPSKQTHGCLFESCSGELGKHCDHNHNENMKCKDCARAATGCHCLLTLHSPYVQVVETCQAKRLQAKCVCVAAVAALSVVHLLAQACGGDDEILRLWF